MKLGKLSLLLVGFLISSPMRGALSQPRTTIFIHGTLFPLISYYYHGVSAPLGISLAKDQPIKNTLGRLGRLLSEAAPTDFPLDTFFLLGWSGHLNAAARLKAAQELYNWLKKQSCESITIIGHSHGGTIALLLAQLAQEENNRSFVIDRLILIACPVQKATSHLITAPVFKKVYNLYSDQDIAQVCDIQGFNFCVPRFSERTFKHSPHLKQAKILLDGKSPGHNDFLLKEQFVVQLRPLLNLLDVENRINHCVANISVNQLLSIEELNV